jgi:putative ABC transport system permease protein
MQLVDERFFSGTVCARATSDLDMESPWRDIRRAVRGLTRSPGVALTIVLSLGMGIGANTTVFTWMDNIVRHPFPAIPRGGELVALNVADADGRVDGMPPIAYPVLEQWRSRAALVERIGAHAQARLNLRVTATGDPVPMWVELADAAFFNTVGVGAWQGRVFDASDAAARANVAVISQALWRRHFGSVPDIVGRTVLLNGVPVTIIGIAPPRFGGVVMGLAFDAWVPLWLQPALVPGSDWMRDRTARRVQAVARLRHGATLPEVNRELNAVARDVSRSFGDSPVTGAAARWIGDTQLGSLIGPLSLAMMAVTALVLLTACSNAAGLLLARSYSRRREAAIQVAVGATRSHLVRHALIEAMVLAAIGCALGLLIAQFTKGALSRLVPPVALPVHLEIDLNGRVAIFAAVVSSVAVLLSTLLPALRGSKLDVVAGLRSATAIDRVRRWRIRSALVVLQVASSLVSLVMAGLFLRSVSAAARVPLGIGDPRQVLLVSTDLSFTRLEGAPLIALVESALDSVRRLPGVAHASFATMVPLGFGGPLRVNTKVDGYVPGPNESMFIARASVSDGYFEAMGIPIVEGRAITRQDGPGSMRSVVVNQSFVARYWPGQRAVGRHLEQGDGWATVVGVAQNSAIDSVQETPAPLVYHTWAQGASPSVTLHVRTRTAPLSLVEPIHQQLSAAHAELPALDPGTLADRMQAATFVQFVGASMFTVFGFIALMIAAVGLHGVVAQLVVERRRDLGVIVALGATPAKVASAVVRPPLTLTLAGLGLGAALAAAAGAMVRSQLVGVSAFDSLSSSVIAAVLLAATAVASCTRPAWRAIHVDPVAAIRGE